MTGKLLGYISGAHLMNNSREIAIYVNVLVNKIGDSTTSIVMLYDLQTKKESQKRITIGEG